MKTFLTAAAVLGLVVGITGTALADAGGQPNVNAYPSGQQTNGRKAACVPPGSVFKTFAQQPGPNNNPDGLGTPGSIVVSECGLGPS